jgi:polar amino acid transport system substrate-binding protein
MSEDFPPYNFKENNIPKGFSIELLDLILRKDKSNIKLDNVTFYPWARSIALLSEDKNAVLFVMTRTKERENIYKWVGPISQAENVLIGKKSLKMDLSNNENLKKYSYCAVKSDAGEAIMHDEFNIGDDIVTDVSDPEMCLQMLSTNRVEMFAYDLNVTKWLMKKKGINFNEYEVKKILAVGEHYFAFNKYVPEEIINNFQKKFDIVKKSSQFETLKKKYLK